VDSITDPANLERSVVKLDSGHGHVGRVTVEFSHLNGVAIQNSAAAQL